MIFICDLDRYFMKLLILSWDMIYDTCITLSEKVIKDCYKIDVIIGISRGGLIPARIFSDIFNIYNIFIVAARYYKDINQKLEKPIISINADINSLNDKNILIVDDLTDTGNTLLTLIDILQDRAKTIKTLTLYKKPKSKFIPDYYTDISDEWIVFPWERCEILRSILKRKEDPSMIRLEDDIMKRLLKIIEGEHAI